MKRIIIAVLFLLAIAIGLFVWRPASIYKQEKAKQPAVSATPKVANEHPPGLKGTAKPSKDGINFAAEIQSGSIIQTGENSFAVGDVEIGNALPYSTAILRLARKRPDLELSQSEAEKLQNHFTKICQQREELEATLAKASVIDESTTRIVVPPYVDKGNGLIADFTEAVTAQFGEEKGKKILSAILPTLLNSNHDFGRAEQELLVIAVANTSYDYLVTRKTNLYNATTGKMDIKSEARDNVYLSSLAEYSQLHKYFPPKK